MTNNGPLVEALVRSQGFAVYTYLGQERFRLIGNLPEWLLELGGANAAPDGTVQLGVRFPFVQNFLTAADEIWKAGSTEQKNSGIWIEKGATGCEIAVEASALWLLGMPILLLRNSQESFQDQSRWLQIARQSRLKHDRLGREIQKKEILLHCIVHDLSQPLSAMRGCFSCLDLDVAPGAAHKLVDTGLKQSQVQEAMIREILDVFSEELATQPASLRKESKPPDIAASALDVVKDYSAAFAETGVRIELDRGVDPSKDWKVAGDESRLRRIFANLVENSLRVSPPNSTVVVGVIDEDRYIRAFVDDEGPGFPGGKAQAPQFSLLGKGKDHGGKAGLGLYFCRITVEQWGGSIGCEQRSKGGARFWFRLPRAERESRATLPQSKTGEQPVGAPERSESIEVPASSSPRASNNVQHNDLRTSMEAVWRPLRILLAEDTEVNQEIMRLMLEKRGHAVVPVNNGRELLASLERESFDLILMDQEMPEMNGMEATRAIRKNERESGKHLPIIGVTGIALMGGKEVCLAAGMDACLPKPFRVDELYETVEGLLFLRGVEAPVAGSSPESVAVDKSPLAYLSGDKKFVRRLVRVFLVDSSKKLTEIRRAISRRDAEQLASSAHALAGSVGVFDAKSVEASSRRLEVMGRSADFNEIDAVFDLLRQEISLLRFHLRRLLAQNADAKDTPRRKKRVRSSQKRAKK